MATMFKKPKRNFRRKVVADSDSDQENENKLAEAENEENGNFMEIDDDCPDILRAPPPLPLPPPPPPPIPELKKVKKKKREKELDSSKVKPLSFDTEEDGDTEVFKVKKSSHSKRIAKQLKKESLKEKKEEDPDSPKKEEKETKEEPQEIAEEKLKKLREEIRTLNGDEDEDDDSDEDGKMVFRSMLARGEIPDARTIHMIRKQRQMARELGDEIPLEEPEAPNKTTARLVRDDEHDRSDEEDRIDFTIDTAARDLQRMRDDFLAAEHGSDNEGSDREIQEWEAQQIRKAVTAANIQQVSSSQDEYEAKTSSPQNYSIFSNGDSQKTKFEPFQALSKTADASQLTIEAIRRRMQERLHIMDEVYRSHKMERDRLATEFVDTQTCIDECEGKCSSLGERYKFFQEMRGYVRDLVECLNEKVPLINDLETRMLHLLKLRAENLLQRRQQDVRDQCQDYMTSKAASKVIMAGNEEQARQRRVAEREARRSRRRRAREAKNIRGHHDGLSSDDEESQTDISKFTMEKDSIVTSARTLFEDVVEDFSEVDCIRSQFEQWKFSYGDSYREAYIGLCLPKLFNPLIRLHTLKWNPIEENCGDFEESQWYACLVFLGLHNEEDEASIEDDDVKLLPAIVDKIILPKLTRLVETVWDPMSTIQTSRLVNLVQRLIRDYPTVSGEAKNTQALLKAISNRMKKTLDDDVFMPMYPKNVLENRSAGPAVFFHRQSWTCIKLLGNILSWYGILADQVLQQIAFDGLLNRYIILSLHTGFCNKDALEKTNAIISTLPKAWFTSADTDKTMPQLEPLCRYLMLFADTMHKSTMLAADTERHEGRENIKQVSKMFVNIHALDHAIFLSNEYSFKIS
ncbi:PAX3- and PAX7-binding protein 1-like [Haliotis cracherodii]|uniref:PAX3- and PAX7-binding protein 1-like n=1 Tax=Haliotis cracherodii TaxID=6455 RepID=UPI0039EB9900